MFWKRKPIEVRIVDGLERNERGEVVERNEEGRIVERVPSYHHLVESVNLSNEDLDDYDKSEKKLENMIQRRECDGFELISTETYEYKTTYGGEKMYITHLFFKKPWTSNYQIKETMSPDYNRRDLNYRFQYEDELGL